MQSAVNAARLNHFARIRHAMGATLALAILFLVVQCLAWIELWNARATIDTGLYAWTFYVLTGLHALHVLGGLPPMLVVFRRSLHDGYTASDHAGLVRCAMYWHALDVIWLGLYVTLWLGS
jgi:cytochrome c oxidase subunit 3